MAELQTNLNVSPFYDDFDEDKQYYRILFRPSIALQARELTQLQTILQKQVSRFGDSIYKDGTIIEGCNFTTYPYIDQVKFKDSNSSTMDFGLLTSNHSDISNSYLLVSNTTGLRAAIFRAFEGAESVVNIGSGDTNRAYVLYLNSGNNAGVQVNKFSTTSEQIDVYDSTQDKSGALDGSKIAGVVYTLTSNNTVNALGYGYGMHVGPGVIYQKGFFLKVLPDNFIIREHGSNAAGIRVGFDTKEYVVTPVEDPSLYDNSIGSPNYAAPGAYRLKLVPEAVHYDVSNNQVSVPANFLPVVEFDGGDGRIVEAQRDPQLSILGDTLARRTSEESGDYIVKPFQIDVTAHESNNQSFYYNASPGIAYVDGYRVELLAPRKIEVPRAVTTNSISNQIVSVNFGNYVEVNNLAGVFDYLNLEEIGIYDQPQQVLTVDQARTSPSGNLVGYANIRAVTYGSGKMGITSGVHNLHIFNIRMLAGKNFSNDAKSFYVDGNFGKCFADIVLDSTGRAYINDTSLARLVFNTGIKGLKTLSAGGVNDTSFVYKDIITGDLTPAASNRSEITFNITGSSIYNYGIDFLTDPQSLEVSIAFAQDTLSNTIITNANNSFANDTVSVITSNVVFTDRFNVGQGILLSNVTSGANTYHTITAINGANSFTVQPNTSISGNLKLQSFFKKGTHVNLQGSGNTFRILTSTSALASLALDPALNSYSMYGQIQVTKNPAVPIKKEVSKDRYVKLDLSTHPAGTTGPWVLGFPDVYKISNVHFGATYSELNTDRKDWFDLITGQTDTHYGLSKLVLIPKYAGSVTGSTKLLVKLNHFTSNISSGQMGFYSIDSYPVDDEDPTNPDAIQTAEIPIYKDQSQVTYDLRNHIDFRSYMTNTAVSATTVGDATINPANNDSNFVLGGAGAQFVSEPGTNFTYDAEYYMPRIDIFLINRDGTLEVKQGLPALKPQTPAINKTGMPIAEIFVPPYPSLTFAEAE